MVNALVKIAQVVDLNVLNNLDTVRPGRELYSPGALKLIRPNVPVRIDHEDGREIRRVLSLVEFDDTDGRWCFARCAIDQAPGWLRRGTAASMSWCKTGIVREMPGGWTQHTRGHVTEVSILSPSVPPFEAGAKVVLLERTSPAAPTTSDRRTAGELVLPAGAILYRPGIGQVLGVR